MDQLAAEIRKIPPVTRLLVASSLAVSIPVFLGILPPYYVAFYIKLALQKLQLWRFYTNFFLGPRGLAYIFELLMLYQSAKQLETGPYVGRSADLAWQLVLVGGLIIAITYPIYAVILERPFLVALVYLASSLAPPGSRTSLMGFTTIPTQYFPYVLIGLDLLIGGPGAAVRAIAGAVAGHIWLWSIWGASGVGSSGRLVNYGRAPAWLRNWFGEGDRRPPPASGAGGASLAAGGVHVVPPRGEASSSSTGHRWGSGQKLGS